MAPWWGIDASHESPRVVTEDDLTLVARDRRCGGGSGKTSGCRRSSKGLIRLYPGAQAHFAENL